MLGYKHILCDNWSDIADNDCDKNVKRYYFLFAVTHQALCTRYYLHLTGENLRFLGVNKLSVTVANSDPGAFSAKACTSNPWATTTVYVSCVFFFLKKI